jgi:hypothetical protein
MHKEPRFKVIFAVVGGFIVGFVFFLQAIDVLMVIRAPVVTGHIIERTPISQYTVPRVDFTIRIDGTNTIVHCHQQRALMNKEPELVRFHYTGDPTRLVSLLDHDWEPFVLLALFWGIALLLALCLRSPRVHELMGW